MFVDTSVVVSILSGEADSAEFARRIEAVPDNITSALVVLEAVMRLSTKLRIEPLEVEASVVAFLAEAQIEIVPIGGAAAGVAVKAFSDYGKGRGHPAQLNLADCLSYACAKEHGVPLLYKGDDFSRTDLG
jgi:ribonuclease VapC